MKYLAITFSLAIFTSCASRLPMPSASAGYFIVPVFSVDESTDYGFSYQYTLRFENQETGKRGSVTVVPEQGMKLVHKKALPVGRYCFDSFFSEPIVKRENRNYNYARNFKPMSGCFNIVERQITIWRNKVAVKRYDKPEGGWGQSRTFDALNEAEKDKVLAELKSYENFNQWTLEFTSFFK